MASHPADIARTAYHKGDYKLAERLLRSLCDREPDTATWHLDLATLLITLIRFDEAEAELKLAASCGARSLDVLRQVAACYFSMQRSDEAKKLLDPAASAGHVPSLFGLAQILEREGKLDEAAQLIREALDKSPTDPELRLLRVRLLLRNGEIDAGEAEARYLLDSEIPGEHKNTAAYLLATHLDRTERYTEAAELLAETKKTAKAMPGVSKLRKDFRDRMSMARELVSKISTGLCEDWAVVAADQPIPFRPALLCGHPRSGTTLLEGQLERLENVISFDETGAFDGGALASTGLVGRAKLMRVLRPTGDKLAMSARSHYARSILSLVRSELAGQPIVIDKNPSQLVNLVLWMRLLPEIRVLVALRDPRDVIVSSYFFELPTNATSVQFLDWDTTAEHYAAMMELWLELKDKLPQGSWQESRYEDLISDTETEMASVAGFLDLSTEVKADESPSATIHSPNYATAGQAIHARSIGRWQHYASFLDDSIKHLDPLLNTLGYK